MRPVAGGLNILQGERATSLGHLLPTLAVIVNQLNALLEYHTNLLTLVIPLINGIKAGISRKLKELGNNVDAQLTAVVHLISNHISSVMKSRKHGL